MLGCSNLNAALGGKDVLFEEALLDELFQVLSEGPAVDDLDPLQSW